MKEFELYEDDELENPGRRKFFKDIVTYGPPALLAISQLIACKSPHGPDIDLKP